jgi:putative transposase
VTETNVFQLSQPGTFADPLTEVLRSGARALLAQAVEAEVAALLASHADKLTEDGRQRLVRHGHQRYSIWMFWPEIHPACWRVSWKAAA